MPHLSQWGDCGALNADGGNAGTDKCCARIASTWFQENAQHPWLLRYL